MRVSAAVVVSRLGGKDEDGTRSDPELREWSHTGKPSGGVEGKKEEAFTNVSVLSGQLSNLCSGPVQVLVYQATQHRRIEPFFLSSACVKSELRYW